LTSGFKPGFKNLYIFEKTLKLDVFLRYKITSTWNYKY
jgi:hypothetical protein